MKVAVGLAAIRPLKPYCPHSGATASILVAVGLAAIRPLKRYRAIIINFDWTVAVGLAAIRPLKQYGPACHIVLRRSCSGFGRYQAVETASSAATLLDSSNSCSGFGRYQAVETRWDFRENHSAVCCSGFGRYQAVETTLFCRDFGHVFKLQWVWPLSGR